MKDGLHAGLRKLSSLGSCTIIPFPLCCYRLLTMRGFEDKQPASRPPYAKTLLRRNMDVLSGAPSVMVTVVAMPDF